MPESNRVGQQLVVHLHGEHRSIECIADRGRVQWRSACLQWAGDMSRESWDFNFKRQQEAMAVEGGK